MMYNKILAPIDGSKLSECSMEHVKEIAAGCHVPEVILLTVLEQPGLPYVEYGSESQVNAAFQERAKDQDHAKETAEKYLSRLSEYLKQKGIRVHTAAIQADANQSIAEAILNYAEINSIDLIVMTTHGRSGITRWAFGSVADRVVRHSKAPVFIIPPAGCRVST